MIEILETLGVLVVGWIVIGWTIAVVVNRMMGPLP